MNADIQDLKDISSKAWILPFGDDIRTAISEFEIVHILAGRQRYTHIPRSPVWCRNVFIWCDRLITLFDLRAYFNSGYSENSSSGFSSSDIVCIVSYEDRQKTIQYGGFLLSSLPVTRVVTDDLMCEYPADNIDWSKIALSCFDDPEFGVIPILDIPEIFCN